MPTNQHVMFLRQFLRNPKRVGSIIPSSRYLASKMLDAVPWNHVSAIAELGSGTGAITRYIEPRISETTKLILFEMDEQMNRGLQKSFPQYSCHPDALHLSKVMNQLGIDHLDCVISCLPFFNFDVALRARLLQQITEALRPGGYFIAFQYSLQMKQHFTEAFDITQIDFVPFNFPPAFVYICRKRVQAAGHLS